MRILISLVLFSLTLIVAQKKYQTSYERLGDFRTFSGVPWYIEGGPNYGSLMDSSFEVVYHGILSHKHWINPDSAPRDIDNESTPEYLPYRAYQTIQLNKATGIGYMEKTLLSVYIWTDIHLQDRVGIDDWLSLITMTCDTSDAWQRTILANLTIDGYIRLVHVPNQGQQNHTFQVGPSNNPTGSKKWKQKRWNRVDMYIDTDSVSGKAILWQNGVKMSEAPVRQCQGSIGTPPLTPYLIQLHLGLYASAMLTYGVVYNDKLRLIEVANDSVAQVLVDWPW